MRPRHPYYGNRYDYNPYPLIIVDDDDSLWKQANAKRAPASPGKTIEQVRGSVLEKKFNLLYGFMFNKSKLDISFGEYLKIKDLTEAFFLKDLPKALQSDSIFAEKKDSEALKQYADKMHGIYRNLLLMHVVKSSKINVDENASDEELLNSLIKKDLSRVIISPNIISADASPSQADISACVLEANNPLDISSSSRLQACLKRKSIPFTVQTESAGSTLGRLAHTILKPLNKFNPAFIVMRQAFRGLVDINSFNLAHNLSVAQDSSDQSHWNKIKNVWDDFGGDTNGLRSSIDIGKNKKALGASGEHYNFAPAAAAATAAPIVASMAAILKDVKGIINTVIPTPVTAKVIPGTNIPSSGDAHTDAAVLASLKGEDSTSGIDNIGAFFSTYKYWIAASAAFIIVIAIIANSKK